MPGLLHQRKSRASEIPTASMADIAFLLLVFFLVVTTIRVETGIGMVLPPVLDHTPPPIQERNILAILINDAGQVMIEGEAASVAAVREMVQRHVLNCVPDAGYGCSDAFAAGPNKALVSIKAGRSAGYAAYVSVLDEVWMAYFEMWDTEARRLGFRDYEAYVNSLPDNAENAVRAAIKANISIAEPDPS